MKAIVVEDEVFTNKHICQLLRNIGIETIGYTNSIEALDHIIDYSPDVLFLDIEMPELNGIVLAEKAYALGYDGEIVYITAFCGYALDAFRVNALDYLLKPIRMEDLNRSIERVKKRRGIPCNICKVSVSLFGNLSVFIGTGMEPVHWITAKSAELYAYMLLKQSEMSVTSKWRMIEDLWPDKESAKAEINLRSTIFRFNKTFREMGVNISIEHAGNGYRLTTGECSLEVDAQILEKITLENLELSEKNFKFYETMILNYQPLLEEFNSEWCHVLRENYHRYFIGSAKKLLLYYDMIHMEPFKRIKVCEHILQYAPYDEEVRAIALQLHYQINGIIGAEKYYKEFSLFLKKELQIEPGNDIKQMYNHMVKQSL